MVFSSFLFFVDCQEEQLSDHVGRDHNQNTNDARPKTRDDEWWWTRLTMTKTIDLSTHLVF
jgi:hypothetical protein